MDANFLNLFGQIGATFIAIIFSFFIGYLLYIKEHRDKIGNDLLALKNRLLQVFGDLQETLIPGVTQSLTSRVPPPEGTNRLHLITGMTAGTSWNMRLRQGGNPTLIWKQAMDSLEELVRGVIPTEITGFPVEKIADTEFFIPKIGVLSPELSKGLKNFLKNTKDIEWFTQDFNGYSWAKTFIEKMREWESIYPNPVMNSQQVATLFEKIITLRRLTPQVFLLEKNYENLKIQNFISNYKLVLTGMLVMFATSVFAPLMLLFTYPQNGIYQFTMSTYSISIGLDLLSFISFIGFIISTLLLVVPLFKTATHR
jgi:hypothetical protein